MAGPMYSTVFVGRPVSAQLANHHKSDVLGGDVGLKRAGNAHGYGLWHLEPQTPSGVDLGHVRRPHACAKRPQGPVGAGMRIGSYQQESGQGKALLGKDLMTDSRAAIKEALDLLLFSPGPHIPLQLCCRLIVGRNDMIEGYDNTFRIPYLLRSHLLESLDGQDTCPVMRHGIIHACLNNLPRLHHFSGTGGPRKNFLAYRSIRHSRPPQGLNGDPIT